MIKQLFTDIKARVQTNASIKHVALFNSQYTHEKEEKVFKFPAVFIEFSQMDFRGEGLGTEKMDAQITFHVCFRQLTEDLSFMDTIQSVSKSLHKWSEDYFTPLQRITEEMDTDHDNVFVWKLIFKTSVTDENSINTSDLVLINDERTIEVVKILDIDNDVIRSGDGL